MTFFRIPGMQAFLVMAALWFIFVVVGEIFFEMPWQPLRNTMDSSRTVLVTLAGWAGCGVIAWLTAQR
jgi:hypothetical protein